jgi:hypothetical protein
VSDGWNIEFARCLILFVAYFGRLCKLFFQLSNNCLLFAVKAEEVEVGIWLLALFWVGLFLEL